MAIAPVSSVSFRGNYNQVNFEGKKKEKSSGLHVSSSIKAIPLATLIALSPLNNSALSNSSVSQSDIRTEQVQHKRELVFQIALPQELGLSGKHGIMFYDTNNDPSDAEKAIYVISRQNGKFTTEIDITDGFTVETVNYRDGSTPDVNYHSTGEAVLTKREANGVKRVQRSWGNHSIDKKAFDFITRACGDMLEVQYKTTTKDKKEMGGNQMFDY